MRFGRLDALRIGRIADVTGLVAGTPGARLPCRRFVRAIPGSAVVGARRSGVRSIAGIVPGSCRAGPGSSIADRHGFAAGQQQSAEQPTPFHFELSVCAMRDRTRFASGLLGWRARKAWAAAFPAAALPLFIKASIRSASASGPSVRCLNSRSYSERAFSAVAPLSSASARRARSSAATSSDNPWAETDAAARRSGVRAVDRAAAGGGVAAARPPPDSAGRADVIGCDGSATGGEMAGDAGTGTGSACATDTAPTPKFVALRPGDRTASKLDVPFQAAYPAPSTAPQRPTTPNHLATPAPAQPELADDEAAALPLKPPTAESPSAPSNAFFEPSPGASLRIERSSVASELWGSVSVNRMGSLMACLPFGSERPAAA